MFVNGQKSCKKSVELLDALTKMDKESCMYMSQDGAIESQLEEKKKRMDAWMNPSEGGQKKVP